MSDLAIRARLSDVLDEYNYKKTCIESSLKRWEDACNELRLSAVVQGTWGETSIDTGSVHESCLQKSLLISAWRHLYNMLSLDVLMTAKDKSHFERWITNPDPFTIDQIREKFGQYVMDPWENILRGLAEVFSSLDPAFKSHEKVKIGVDGLPKRVIISGFGGYSQYGREKITDIINALAAYQQKPLVERHEIDLLINDGDSMLREGIGKKYKTETYEYDQVKTVARGIRLRVFKNGNAHLFFEPDTLKDINRALAKYYGDVLPDLHEEKPERQKASTSVSKDLQYYPTPAHVVDRVLNGIIIRDDDIVLEPSCGCGRFMDGIKKQNHNARIDGIEYDHERAMIARSKGHAVAIRNFLEVAPEEKYTKVIMNPPFYGRHYAKHVEHALKFLKKGGVLFAILPITARYDHQLLSGSWSDLPVGSFRESGTNINTTVLTICK